MAEIRDTVFLILIFANAQGWSTLQEWAAMCLYV